MRDSLLLSGILQVLLAVSVFYVWGLNFQTMTAEWPSYRLPDWVRVATGLTKLTAAVLLILGTLAPMYTLPAALIMGAMMTIAMLLHVSARDSVGDTLPSTLLTALSAAIVYLNWPLGGVAAFWARPGG